eukprot:TRINITY_DN2016_c0_g1_i1.p1 TRINITY_DN2016_c0_g1~~TRINITY_DN2016_c0_g1_i1.p1  ORF type:complete len:516 (+),score=-21.00 TRINITY_DN2016_c0_g1_i1:144-1550(+)
MLNQACNTIDQASEWSSRFGIHWNNPGRLPTANFDGSLDFINVNLPALPDAWAPQIEPLDLSSLTIPNRLFSAKEELAPVVDQIFGMAYWFSTAAMTSGVAMVALAGAPIGFEISKPWLPDILIKNRLLLSGWRFTATITKQRVFVPLLIGVSACVGSIALNVGVEKAQGSVSGPLAQADAEIASVVKKINAFDAAATQLFIGWTNQTINTINRELLEDINAMVVDAEEQLNNVVSSLVNGINSKVLAPITSRRIGTPSRINLRSSFPDFRLPFFPPVDLSAIHIPEELLALQKTLLPILNELLGVPRAAIGFLYISGLAVTAIPAATVLANVLSPWIPPAITNFLREPSSKKEADVDGPSGMSPSASQHALSRTKSQTSNLRARSFSYGGPDAPRSVPFEMLVETDEQPAAPEIAAVKPSQLGVSKSFGGMATHKEPSLQMFSSRSEKARYSAIKSETDNFCHEISS